MTYHEKYLKALELVREHHDLETICHVERVAAEFGPGKDKVVALLHDIVEDTDVTVDDLYAEFDFDAELADEVAYITRKKGCTYAEYIRDIGTLGSDTTLRVKIADLKDHLYGAPTEPPGDLGVRYVKALVYLEKCVAYRKDCGDYLEEGE